MEDTSARVSNGPYEAGLQRTIQELEGMKMELEAALDQLRASTRNHVPDGGISAKDSLEIITKAFQDEAESKPLLPPPGSVLPALLAMRQAHQTISESNEYIDSQAASVEQIERQIEAERTNLREQQALQVALENRIKSLREGLEKREEKTEEQIAKERIAELRQQKDHWDKQTSSLMKQLDWFISEHLGPMLAAEELGGPVVGDLTEIDPDDLTAGFSAYGKLKKAKDQPDQDKRQRRIDDIWGPQEQPGQANKRKRDRDEASAASAEMRDLTEQLMNKLMESGGDNSAAYVEIPRESAAARFLVRSKVAVFHPKDARRLRLVDFGRDVDD
ncbi:Centromere protein Cenp-K [Madurella fahalii]|uniref:Centromere protein Cenp-K n=1 Tax=Madurella fahalii TaxID=1157608 RepID=A0ABQ0FZM8_9PEZI